MKEYNGWPNHETWAMSLYCNSLEDVHALREYLEEMPFFDLPLPVMDLLLSAMAEIKWDYLERSYAEDNAEDNAD